MAEENKVDINLRKNDLFMHSINFDHLQEVIEALVKNQAKHQKVLNSLSETSQSHTDSIEK